MSVFDPEYRVVSDHYAGYEVQIRRWWFPFWMQAGGTNTHPTLEHAERWAKRHANKSNVIKNVGRLSRKASEDK